jgi:hypothetical protein
MIAAAAAAAVVVVVTQNKRKKRNCMFGLQKLAREVLGLKHQYYPFAINGHFCHLGKHNVHCRLSCTVEHTESWETDFCLKILQAVEIKKRE